MEGRRGGGPIKGMPERCAVDGPNIARRGSVEGVRPRDEALGELLGVPLREDPPKGVMPWKAMREVEQVGQPLGLGLPILFEVFPPLCSADDCTHRNDEHIHQEMAALRGVGAAGIGQRDKMILKR